MKIPKTLVALILSLSFLTPSHGGNFPFHSGHQCMTKAEACNIRDKKLKILEKKGRSNSHFIHGGLHYNKEDHTSSGYFSVSQDGKVRISRDYTGFGKGPIKFIDSNLVDNNIFSKAPDEGGIVEGIEMWCCYDDYPDFTVRTINKNCELTIHPYTFSERKGNYIKGKSVRQNCD